MFGKNLQIVHNIHTSVGRIQSHNVFLIFIALSLFAKFVYTFAYQPLFEPEVSDAIFTDLPIFHSAAQAAFGFGVSPYDVEMLKNIGGESTLPFLYPPPGLLQFLPLTPLTYEQAKIYMIALNHVLLLGTIYLIARHFVPRDTPHAELMTFGIVIFTMWYWPSIITIKLGQVNLLMVFLVVLFLTFLKEGKDLRAGAVLALCVAVKTYPIFLGLPLLLHGRYRALAGATITGISVLIVTFAIVPLEAWAAWFTDVAPSGGLTKTPEGMFWPGSPYNQSINGVLARLFDRDQDSAGPGAQWARVVGYSSIALVFIASTFACRVLVVTRKPEAVFQSLNIFLLAIFLMAPLTWNHHATYLLPVIVSALLTGFHAFSRRPIVSSFLLGACLLLSIPTSPGMLNLNIIFLAVSALWYANLTQAFAMRRTSVRSPQIAPLIGAKSATA